MVDEELQRDFPSQNQRTNILRLNRAVYWFSRHWLLVIFIAWGIFNLLPWLAPVFMRLGWTGPAQAIYLAYTFLCHQLPQRSFFLFGEQPMYDLEQIQAVWQNTNNPLILRQFTGNELMGWKVAWSDRMVSFYTGMLLWLGLFGVWRHLQLWRGWKPWFPRLPLWGLVILVTPMVLDGITHMLSDMFSGVGAGFRYDNAWLAMWTDHSFSATFYAGNNLGSFNSWMRLLTGLLFGLGVVWFILPTIEASFTATARELQAKFQGAGISL